MIAERNWLEGAVDIHVHAGPELFRRVGDGIDVARRCRSMGMRGIVLKCHHESTVGRAAYAAHAVPGIEVIGGVVLNDFVGGLNPLAVSATLESGGRIVWMPTIHAQNHIDVLGAGTYGTRGMTLSTRNIVTEGISVLNRGALKGEVSDIIAIVKEYDATLATGHLGMQESLILIEAARLAGVRCLVTHAFFPEHTMEFLVSAAQMGAWIEVSAVVAYPMARHYGHSMTYRQVLDLIESVGAGKIVVSSDAGQIHNPWPDAIVAAFARALRSLGVADDDLGRMMAENPAHALGLPVSG